MRIGVLRDNFMLSMKDRCGEYVFRNFLTKGEIMEARQIGKEKKLFARRIRKKSHYQNLNSLSLEDLEIFPDIDEQPIIFHDLTRVKES